MNFARVKRHFLRDDAALRNFETGFGMAFNLVDAFDDDFGGFREGGQNFALLTLILTGKDNNGIALFNVKFDKRQNGSSFL